MTQRLDASNVKRAFSRIEGMITLAPTPGRI